MPAFLVRSATPTRASRGTTLCNSQPAGTGEDNSIRPNDLAIIDLDAADSPNTSFSCGSSCGGGDSGGGSNGSGGGSNVQVVEASADGTMKKTQMSQEEMVNMIKASQASQAK